MPEIKEWTLMFYFASDNPLAISVVSQLKAIKAAGFHPEANVVAHFDPYTEGTPTHIFDVNLINKLKNGRDPHIGFCEDEPVVRNMIEDKLWRDERTRPAETAAAGAEGELVRTALHRVLEDHYGIDYRPPIAPFSLEGLHSNGSHRFVPEPDPETSLSEFLRFCADNYPAQHYMLFILGHGVVVGNDIFMRDEHTTSKNSLTLTELGRILTDFKNSVALENGKFELVSFQSCSVSSLEVAFELQDTANFMLASQGPTFVGSWPYRQILIRIFNEIGRDRTNRNINVRDLLLSIYNYCLFNSADFLLAGYSFQITLCDLRKISTLKDPIENLSQALLDGLLDLTSKDYILLSHWKSQSFFNEMYTDLYDFCFCFNNKVKELRDSRGRVTPQLRAIEAACDIVMDKLVKENPKRAGDPVIEQFIVGADSLGPAYQYSRGVSVYFPWSEPSRDSRIMAEYEGYRFSTDFENASWLMFLREYFTETMREVSSTEPDARRFLPLLSVAQSQDQRLDEDLASLVYSGEGLLNGQDALALKSDPMDKMGGETEAPSIKNYPRDIRPRRARGRQARQPFALTESFRVLNGNGRNGNHA